MKLNLPVSGRAANVSSSANILSTTDLKGAVSYVNQDFIDISGYSAAELLGLLGVAHPHRHADPDPEPQRGHGRCPPEAHDHHQPRGQDEAVPPRPLHLPIDTHTPVARAAYANAAVARQLRPRLVEACRRRGLLV